MLHATARRSRPLRTTALVAALAVSTTLFASVVPARCADGPAAFRVRLLSAPWADGAGPAGMASMVSRTWSSDYLIDTALGHGSFLRRATGASVGQTTVLGDERVMLSPGLSETFRFDGWRVRIDTDESEPHGVPVTLRVENPRDGGWSQRFPVSGERHRLWMLPRRDALVGVLVSSLGPDAVPPEATADEKEAVEAPDVVIDAAVLTAPWSPGHGASDVEETDFETGADPFSIEHGVAAGSLLRPLCSAAGDAVVVASPRVEAREGRPVVLSARRLRPLRQGDPGDAVDEPAAVTLGLVAERQPLAPGRWQLFTSLRAPGLLGEDVVLVRPLDIARDTNHAWLIPTEDRLVTVFTRLRETGRSPTAARAGADVLRASEFDWLAGCWAGQGGMERECWLPAAGGVLFGINRTLGTDGKERAFEHLRIEERPDGIAYVARPGGGEPVTFRLVEHGPENVVFENPRHDFPQRVEYALLDDGRQLCAAVSDLTGERLHRWCWRRARR